MRKIEEIYGLGKLQDFLTLYQEIKKRGFGLDDLAEYVEERRAELNLLTAGKSISRHCPECNNVLRLSPVNREKRDQTGDGSRSVWSCPHCYRQEFSEMSVTEQIKKYREGD